MFELHCDRCGQALTQPGALAFSPPASDRWMVQKYHLCVDCWAKVVREFGNNSGGDSQSQPRQKTPLTEIERLVKQLQRTFQGPTWHGPAVEEVLAGVTAETAGRLAPGCAHTIWQMVEHMRIWEHAVQQWLIGDRHRPPDEETRPAPTDTSESAWSATLDRLRATHAELVDQVAQLDESRLAERIFDDMPNLYAILHGVVQHNVYHAGQIAVLKKAAT